MNAKYVVPGAVVVVFIAIVAIFAMQHAGPQSAGTAQPNSLTAGNSNTADQGVTPIDTNVGSIAGVDLSEFANQANQSAAAASQDGASDAKNISSLGQTINSSTDSVNNPIQ